MTNVAHGSNDSCVACNMANGYKNQFPFWENIENLILKNPFFVVYFVERKLIDSFCMKVYLNRILKEINWWRKAFKNPITFILSVSVWSKYENCFSNIFSSYYKNI